MTILTYPEYHVNPQFPDATSELDWQALRARVDYASRWAFYVYDLTYTATNCAKKAAKKATSMYVKLMDGAEGQVPLWPYLR